MANIVIRREMWDPDSAAEALLDETKQKRARKWLRGQIVSVPADTAFRLIADRDALLTFEDPVPVKKVMAARRINIAHEHDRECRDPETCEKPGTVVFATQVLVVPTKIADLWISEGLAIETDEPETRDVGALAMKATQEEE